MDNTELIMNDEQKIAQTAMADPKILRIYANGFVAGLGQGDVFVVLQAGLTTVAVLEMSYNVAKTLAISLGGAVESFEKSTGQTIMTVQEIKAKLESGKGDSNGGKA